MSRFLTKQQKRTRRAENVRALWAIVILVLLPLTQQHDMKYTLIFIGVALGLGAIAFGLWLRANWLNIVDEEREKEVI